MASTSVVNFPAFRQHTEAREAANTAIMGLLVGSQMAAHFLTLLQGSGHLLPSLFPGVPHVGRFNLTSEGARDVLVHADEHLGTMAVPYAFSIHEDLMRSCIELLGQTPPHSVKQLHSTLATVTGGTFHADSLSQFHLLREMRNAAIHSGGVIDQRVPDCVRDMSPAALTNWKRVTGRSPANLAVGNTVTFLTGELFLTLATTKALARQANGLINSALTSEQWAAVIISDLTTPDRPTGNPSQLRKRLLGWKRFHYSAAAVSEADLVAAARSAGLHV